MTPRTASLGLPLLALLLAGCGSTTTTATTAPAPAASRPAGGGQPGVVGLVAAVDGTEVQVQNKTAGQVAVDVSAKTRITVLTAGTRADVAVGDCLTAAGTPDAAGTGLTATTLTVSKPAGGSCAGNRRGNGGGGGPSRRPRPSGAPTPPAGAARMATLTGTVRAVSGSTVTVAGALRGRGASPAAGQTVTVTIASGTRIRHEAAAGRTAIRAGLCLAAFGPSNSIGAVQAKTISIFPATGGACTGGFGGAFGGRGMGGGNGGN